MNKRLIIAFMLTGIVVFAGMTGCGGGSTSDGGDTTPDKTKVVSSADLIAALKATLDLDCAEQKDNPKCSIQLVEDITLTESWEPIGEFTGKLDGKGKTISGLSISKDSGDVGLFGKIGAGGEVKDLTIDITSMVGKKTARVGVLAAENKGTITNVKITGTGTVLNTSSDLLYGAGGLVSLNAEGGVIDNSHTDVTVEGINYIDNGGLVGKNQGVIKNSSATGNVKGGSVSQLGGLVGENTKTATIENSYAAGKVYKHGTGRNKLTAGGLVGLNYGAIKNSYALGNVRDPHGFKSEIGGLVGLNYGAIKNSYAIGDVTGNTHSVIGGLVGLNSASVVKNSYFDASGTGQSDTGRGVAVSRAANIVQISVARGDKPAGYYDNVDGTTDTDDTGNDKQIFEDWSFSDIWKWEGDGQWPKLYWQP